MRLALERANLSGRPWCDLPMLAGRSASECRCQQLQRIAVRHQQHRSMVILRLYRFDQCQQSIAHGLSTFASVRFMSRVDGIPAPNPSVIGYRGLLPSSEPTLTQTAIRYRRRTPEQPGNDGGGFGRALEIRTEDQDLRRQERAGANRMLDLLPPPIGQTEVGQGHGWIAHNEAEPIRMALAMPQPEIVINKGPQRLTSGQAPRQLFIGPER